MEKLPTLAVDLIEALQKLYPQRCPDESWTDRKIWMYTGAAAMVRSLGVLLEQEKNEFTTVKEGDD